MTSSKKTMFFFFISALALLAVYAVYSEYFQTETNYSLPDLKTDSSRVTGIVLRPRLLPEEPISIMRNHGLWKVEMPGKDTLRIPNLGRILKNLSRLKAQRVLCTDPNRFKLFWCSGNGTDIKVYENGSFKYGLTFGRFYFAQDGSIRTAFKILGKDTVYEAEGFYENSFNSDLISQFRH